MGNKEDIINELADELYSQKEEKEIKLGRSLSETELESILHKFGDPIEVASKYRKNRLSIKFGRQLISPELFTYYIWILLFNALITTGWIIFAIIHNAVNVPMILLSVIIQFFTVTFVFILIDLFRRKFPRDWFFTPSKMVPLISIPYWKSITGLILWIVFGLWWMLLPRFQFLLFGYADNLKLTAGFLSFYLPVLLLLAIGIVQRITNIFRPNWTLLPPITRFISNLGGLLIIYFMYKAYPYVTVADISINTLYYQNLAEVFNAIIYWGFVVTWLWIFFLANLISNAVILFHYLKRLVYSKNIQ
jgi:hypothetical protein